MRLSNDLSICIKTIFPFPSLTVAIVTLKNKIQTTLEDVEFLPLLLFFLTSKKKELMDKYQMRHKTSPDRLQSMVTLTVLQLTLR